MDSELPAVNTAQLETPVFHRDHNEPPSSQQSVTNRCSTSRSFDQNFAQLPSVEVPLGTPIRVGHRPYAEPCTNITDVNHNHHDNTYHTLETPRQVSSRSEGYSNFISPMPVVYPHFDPAFFHRNQIASQPTDHHDDYTANGTELSRFFSQPSESTPSNQHSSTLSWEIPLFTPQSATATQAGSSSTEPPTESSSENMAKRIIPTNNDSQTEVRFLLF